jgi:hypothetical protein
MSNKYKDKYIYNQRMMNSVSPSFARRSPRLVSPFIQIPDNVESFDFDTYLIDECFVLKNIAGHLFKKVM